MMDRIKKWLGEDDDNFPWYWLLVIPVVAAAVVRIAQRVRRLNEAYPEGPRGALVPATGLVAEAPPSVTEMERTDFREVSREHQGQEMARFSSSAMHDIPEARTVNSQPANPPAASEDSKVDVAQSSSMGQAHHSDQEMPAHPLSQVDETAQAEDFRVIEGIGPSISALLHRSGILSFKQLADAQQEHLLDILDQAGIRQITDPTTWPEQARLAADGKWDELTELQGNLRHGRRID